MIKRHVIVSILVLLYITPIYSNTSAKSSSWSKKTHSNSVDPNYHEVFTDGEVKRIELTISSSDWAAMWDDISNNLGFNNHQMNGGGGGAHPTNSTTDFTPIHVPCSVTYNGREWNKVGVRFKGNSSLMRANMEGSKKVSLKLDFDEYEDQYPELKNQRFYGFKQLNLNSNFNDTSFIRELVASKIYQSFGLVAARAVPCEVYIDFGEGSQYYGLYTIVEEVDDSVIKTQFKDGSGNLYKPEERAGSFAEGTFEQSEFYIKNGKKGADYSDVEALYTILNSTERISNEESWKNKLEAAFDVDVFLKWLAVNSTIQNWDTYGNMAHNYYLYNNPQTNKLTWIPWDHNEAFQDGMNSYNPGQLGSVGAEWPLISYIISIDEYREKYNNYLDELINNIFTTSNMLTIYDSYYSLLRESVYSEVTARTYMRYYKMFDQSIEAMKSHVSERTIVVENYLTNPSVIEKVMTRGNFGGRDREPNFGGPQRGAPLDGDDQMMPAMRKGPPQAGAQGERPMMMHGAIEGDSTRMTRGEMLPPPTAAQGERPMMIPSERPGGPMGANPNTVVEGEALPMESESTEPMDNNFRGRRGNIPIN